VPYESESVTLARQNRPLNEIAASHVLSMHKGSRPPVEPDRLQGNTVLQLTPWEGSGMDARLRPQCRTDGVGSVRYDRSRGFDLEMKAGFQP
jgi:hypothetical protein